ncbi:MotA/TolQ/ExbB proton channel family protein, partial [Polymorphobacter multimanifer]
MEPVIATATEISPWALFLQADIVVKLVMLGLLMASVWSWAIIFERSRAIRRINREATQFEDWFWKAESLDALFEPATRATHPSARLFVSGMNEWRRSLARGRFDREGIRTRLASTTQVSIG